MIRNTILLTLVFVLSFQLKAQKEVVKFLQFSNSEHQVWMMEQYLQPLAKMQNGNLNSGWYHTVKPHRFLGFDLSLSMASTNMSDIKKGFYVTDMPGFEDGYIVSANPISPNVSGTTPDLPQIKRAGSGEELDMPNGSGLQKITIPMLSLGVGLPYRTELRFNILPEFDNDDLGKTSKYGASIKHSIKEYIPGLSEIPMLSLAMMGGYGIMKNDVEVIQSGNDVVGQVLQGETSGYTGRLLVGMDMRFFSAFAGVGYGASTVEYALKGNYYVGSIADQDIQKDPVLVSYDFSQIDVNFGVNIKVKFFDIFADYSLGGYNTFNFGLGYSFR
ncbi:DUF6588 family protein [Plebeiibacterium marinum]|uniref:Uncharacterized protein n=1 Tax=Plebeiibacterium marinum TaxID=2992111 RepID=A0AAE3MAA5_9BACT|nr:DUF6588 family protein [Plebeiobacterium marinum]MCW3804186.1 hypothetical protein [Plebeiobacterium marinum]